MTGKLTVDEEKALASFAHLMKIKYGFQSPETYLGEIFYKYDGVVAWRKLKKLAGERDYILIKGFFLMFRNRFELVWSKEHIRRLNTFKKSMQNKKTTQFLDSVAFMFGKAIAVRDTMTLIILFSPQDFSFTAAGSANLIGNFISIELPDMNKHTWQLSYSVALIGHEIGHLYFKKRKGKTMIVSALKKLQLKKQYNLLPFATFTVINEAITSAFVPIGSLGQKYFSNMIADLLFSNLPRGFTAGQALREGKPVSFYSNIEIYFVWKLFPIAYQYVREKKPIDRAFIIKTALLLKDLMKQKTGNG
ncbi:MAG: hypothetical protein Q8L47_00500 [bacterium]|nr:hypothetical protein [bacterium]